jgi:hypothetical protein
MSTTGSMIVFAYFSGNKAADIFDRDWANDSVRAIAPGIHGVGFPDGSTFHQNGDGTWKNHPSTGTGWFERINDNGIVVEIPVKIWKKLPQV